MLIRDAVYVLHIDEVFDVPVTLDALPLQLITPLKKTMQLPPKVLCCKSVREMFLDHNELIWAYMIA
jgi:hypothetical protein